MSKIVNYRAEVGERKPGSAKSL